MAFRPTLTRLAKGARSSSKQWLQRQNNDPFVKKRTSGFDPSTRFRSRSAFKLVEINDHWDNFLAKSDVHAVVDLGAAPGGWSQVVSAKLGWTPMSITGEQDGGGQRDLPVEKPSNSNDVFDPLALDEEDFVFAPIQGRGVILAVDLLAMRPIPGVHDIVADFLLPSTSDTIKGLLKKKKVEDAKVDVILSDMAANASGNITRDIECSLQIGEAVMEFARRHLRTARSIGRKRGGVVLMKHFAHPELDRFREEHLVPNFNLVKYIKPDSSRPDSREGYFLCMGWRG